MGARTGVGSAPLLVPGPLRGRVDDHGRRRARRPRRRMPGRTVAGAGFGPRRLGLCEAALRLSQAEGGPRLRFKELSPGKPFTQRVPPARTVVVVPGCRWPSEAASEGAPPRFASLRRKRPPAPRSWAGRWEGAGEAALLMRLTLRQRGYRFLSPPNGGGWGRATPPGCGGESLRRDWRQAEPSANPGLSGAGYLSDRWLPPGSDAMLKGDRTCAYSRR